MAIKIVLCDYSVIYMIFVVIVVRPTQSIMYVPLQVNRSQKCILLIIQYKYIKSCSGDFYSPEFDPPHKIMRYWVYYSTQLFFGFPPDKICPMEMICIGGVPVLKRHFGGAGKYFTWFIWAGRVPGLGQITWWIVYPKNWGAIRGKNCSEIEK